MSINNKACKPDLQSCSWNRVCVHWEREHKRWCIHNTMAEFNSIFVWLSARARASQYDLCYKKAVERKNMTNGNRNATSKYQMHNQYSNGSTRKLLATIDVLEMIIHSAEMLSNVKQTPRVIISTVAQPNNNRHKCVINVNEEGSMMIH